MTRRRLVLRLAGTALFWTCGALMLSASSCVVPPPVPGQPMTAQQKAYAKLLAQQDAHDRSRNSHPCRPGGCR
jgi:hypothetical protein